MSDDRRFVSADAATLVVLKARPESERGDFGAIYRKGDRAAVLTAGSLHLPGSAIHGAGYNLAWLAPREARETPTGVEVELLDGSLLVVGFDGKSAVTPSVLSSPAVAAVPTENCAPCSYTDAEGVYHYVETAAEVPEQYRGVARGVRGGVYREENVVIVRSPDRALDRSVASPHPPDPTVAPVWVDDEDRAEDAEAARVINSDKSSPNRVHDTVTNRVEDIVTNRVEDSVKPMQ
ncbi:MAG TPA: hypothetical protein VGJ67_05590 [Actinomycetota bacterium]